MGSINRGRKRGWKIFSNLGYYATTIGRYSDKPLRLAHALMRKGSIIYEAKLNGSRTDQVRNNDDEC